MTGENDTPPGIPGARRSAGARTGGDGGLAAEAAVWYHGGKTSANPDRSGTIPPMRRQTAES